jgi:hypothetical protein
MSSQVSSTLLPTASARISWARIVGGAALLEVLLVALLTPIGLVFGSPFLEGSTDTTVFLVAVPAGCFVFAAIVSGWLFRHVTYRAVLQGGLVGVVATMLYLLLCLGAPGGLPGAIAGYGVPLFWGTQALRIIGGAVGPAFRQAKASGVLT